MFMLFKFASEHKLIITVLAFIYLWYLAIRVKCPCTQSINHFLAFLALIDDVAVVDTMVGVKGCHSVKHDVS